MNSAPVIDGAYRLAYRTAYRLMRLYWRARHPETHGALVALWHAGQILLVQNSYVPYFSLPGGYVRPGESGKHAALRELAEELHLRVPPEQLREVVDHNHTWEGKRERVQIFELDVAETPALEVDRREVIAARFFTPAEALAQNLFPPIRLAIEARVGARRAHTPG